MNPIEYGHEVLLKDTKYSDDGVRVVDVGVVDIDVDGVKIYRKQLVTIISDNSMIAMIVMIIMMTAMVLR